MILSASYIYFYFMKESFFLKFDVYLEILTFNNGIRRLFTFLTFKHTPRTYYGPVLDYLRLDRTRSCDEGAGSQNKGKLRNLKHDFPGFT